MNMQHQFTIGYLGDVPEEQEGLYLLLMYMGLAEIMIGDNKGNRQTIGMIRHTINQILKNHYISLCMKSLLLIILISHFNL